MIAYLLAVVTVAYLWAAFSYWQEGRVGMAVVFGAYAIANVGFILDLKP